MEFEGPCNVLVLMALWQSQDTVGVWEEATPGLGLRPTINEYLDGSSWPGLIAALLHIWPPFPRPWVELSCHALSGHNSLNSGVLSLWRRGRTYQTLMTLIHLPSPY